jgi:hypothetical protein
MLGSIDPDLTTKVFKPPGIGKAEAKTSKAINTKTA